MSNYRTISGSFPEATGSSKDYIVVMDNNKKSLSAVAVVLLLLAVGLIGFGIKQFFFKQAPLPLVQNGAEIVPDMTQQQVAEIVHQGRVAVGHLENDRFQDAEAILAELSRKVPQEPIAVRNLVIARLRLLEDNKGDASPVNEALESLRQVEPEAPSTYWMSGRVNAKLAETATDEELRQQFTSRAVADFERAAKLGGNNPVFPFQLYSYTQYHADEAVVKRGQAALQRAYELRPDNLFILTETLSSQAKGQDPAIQQTIVQAKTVLGPLASSIETRTRINVMKLLDQAATAASAKNLVVVRQNIAPLMGVVRSEEVSRSDMRRIDVNPLEFIEHEFSTEFVARHPLEQPPRSEVSLRFELIDPAETASQLADVKDVRVVDFDMDDKPDLVLLRDGRLEAYQLTAAGKLGRRIAGSDVPADLTDLLIADLDQDTIPKTPPAAAAAPADKTPSAEKLPEHCFKADGDVVLYGPGGFLVLRNELNPGGTGSTESRSFQPATQEDPLDSSIPVISAVLVDMDHDGDLDIVASTEKGIRLWSNRGRLLFEDLSSFSSLPPEDLKFDALEIIDWERDVDIDIFLSGTSAARVGYLESLRHGQFRWRPLDEEFKNIANQSQLVPLEADGNGSWDLAAVGKSGIQVTLTKTLPATSVTLTKEIAVSSKSYEHVAVSEFDNDGYRDLLVWGDSGINLWRGSAQGEFQQAESLFDDPGGEIQDCEAADVDQDGDIDIAAIRDGKLILFLNQTDTQAGYLALRCHGDEDNKSGRVNHWGIGSLVELKAGGLYQARTITSDVTHFGLGQSKQAEVVRVLWTQGIPQAVIEPAANQVLCEPMVLKGSCPYVYTWNGQQFEFFTDLLWSAPLGLQFADGVIAPDRPWEYLKIPGEKLQAKEGHYELRITEELWEAAYFDQVKLIAVDHPANIEVFSNEKVGPAEIAEFRIHTVRQRRPLVAATDHRGRDLLSKLQSADGDVAKAFDHTLRQGLAEPHYLELDLGRFENAQRITLFLTGWIRPTDTSLNVAISHDPDLDAPRPPSIWVADAGGQWREAVKFMGFPGGKTKTIAVDLSRILPASDHRLRIATSAELYWDEAFFTVDEEPAEVELTVLDLTFADLRYRGFSAAVPGPRTLPEVYDYEELDKDPRWPPMRGRLTRFGDVGELLREMDAKLVVMGSGDEMVLRFAVPDLPVRDGWKRDYILHNVGWDKDADLNTVFGQTIEPLPFVGMTSYPYIDSHLLDSESNREYLRRYQTRETDRDAFWRMLISR